MMLLRLIKSKEHCYTMVISFAVLSIHYACECFLYPKLFDSQRSPSPFLRWLFSVLGVLMSMDVFCILYAYPSVYLHYVSEEPKKKLENPVSAIHEVILSSY